jgi:hypothetical protein
VVDLRLLRERAGVGQATLFFARKHY